MNAMQKAVYKAIAPKTPRKFEDVKRRAESKGLDWHTAYDDVDRALQALRRAGKIKYLKKADSGPGWVRT